MTTKPLSPDTPDSGSDDVDFFASRLVDGDVTTAQIPDGLRVEVERRAVEFSRLRSLVRESRSQSKGSTLREAQIAHALRSVSDSKGDNVFQQRASRAVLAAVASIIGVLVVSTLVLRQDDSDNVDVFADSVSDDSGQQEALSQSAPALESESGSAKSLPSETESPAMSTSTSGEDDLPLVNYASVDDIARVAASLPPGGTVIEGLNQSVEVPRCAVGPTPPLRTEGALLEGVRVEIHFRERGEFAVYDISNCSMVTSRPALP
ncbi:MAG: hypothetical protein ACKOI2_06640 [Actinomycetota bacterium]